MKALILGITGQDGSYLAEILLAKGYEVHGMKRKTSGDNTHRIWSIKNKITLHDGDMLDPTSLYRLIDELKPDELYNEADLDHAGVSFDMPQYSAMVTGLAAGYIFEVVRKFSPNTKIFQPLTSNMFAFAEGKLNENTPLNPNSPYACAKAYAFHLSKFYRRLGLKVYTAIFFNHTSIRQSNDYIAPKIFSTGRAIANKEMDYIELGDLDAEIDLGYARDFMEVAWKIMQGEPDDFVIGTGQTVTIRQLTEMAGIHPTQIRINPKFIRPTKTGVLVADITKAKEKLGYEPRFFAGL